MSKAKSAKERRASAERKSKRLLRSRLERGSSLYNYEAEPNAKKVARAYAWQIHAWEGEDRYGGMEPARVLCLASAEGGDIATCLAYGVLPANIVAVDLNPEAAAACAEKYPEVNVITGDIAELAPRLGTFTDICLDFCGTWSDDMSRVVSTVLRHCAFAGTMFTLGVMRGRERGNVRELVGAAKRRFSKKSATAGLDTREEGVVARAFVIDKMLEGAFKRHVKGRFFVPHPRVVTYQSRVPMMYRNYTLVERTNGMSFSQHKEVCYRCWMSALEKHPLRASVHVDADIDPVKELLAMPGLSAQALNLDPRSVAARKAWVTRRKPIVDEWSKRLDAVARGGGVEPR